MNINQFIRVGDKTFSAEDICRRLGIDPEVGLKISVGQPANGGMLEASVALGDPEDCPCVDVNFCPDGEHPILLSHVEQDVYETDNNGEPAVRTFLYDRAESYVAYLAHNLCPESELGDEILNTTLVAGGDGDVIVSVYRENRFVKWEGELNERHPQNGSISK